MPSGPEHTDHRDRAVECALSILAKQFPDVQLLCSYVNESGETAAIAKGFGNWYARVGMAREFMITDQANTESFVYRQSEDD